MSGDAPVPRPKAIAALAFALAGLCVEPFSAPVASAQHGTTLTRRERPLASLPFDASGSRSVVISPDGTRGAYVRPLKGGTLLVVVDGNASPQAYEQLGRNLVFSPDSRHVAFAGSRGDHWYVVVDGAEGDPFDSVVPDSIVFSPQGDRVACVAELDGRASVVTNETPGKAYDAIVDGSLVFAVDGRLAYVARAGGKESLVLDGEEGKSYDTVGRPRFSRDGRHVAFAAAAGGTTFVVIDGVEGRARPADDPVHPLSLLFSPSGAAAYVVGPRGRVRAVIDGVEGRPYEQVFDDSIAFSPEGRRFAYVAVRGGADGAPPRSVVVVDGKEGPPHQGVVPGSIRFSPDGRRFAYLSERSGPDGAVRRSAVVDGVEGKPYDWVCDAPVFSPDGRHYAYVAQRRIAARPPAAPALGAAPVPPPARNSRDDVSAFESFAVVDGAEAGPYPWVRGDLQFTPDARRVAYLAAAADPRFTEAGELPADPTNPAAGARLVFERAPGHRALSAEQVKHPVKLLVVEETIAAE